MGRGLRAVTMAPVLRPDPSRWRPVGNVFITCTARDLPPPISTGQIYTAAPVIVTTRDLVIQKSTPASIPGPAQSNANSGRKNFNGLIPTCQAQTCMVTDKSSEQVHERSIYVRAYDSATSHAGF